jgi:LCP family protein required for cell wall assembly
MVLGSDRRFDDRKAGIKPRSDTIILVRLDPSQGATAILSIPRDLKVTYTRQDGTEYSGQDQRRVRDRRPRATVRKVKEVMGGRFPIHHVVNINFGAFTRAVNRLGCFYVDIDRRYFNDNSRRSRARRTTPRSTCSRATRSSAARTRWTSCASATSTRTSCAARASSTT